MIPTIRLLLLISFSLIASAVEWKPITTEELSLSQPVVEKNADAEAVFWEVRVYDRIQTIPYVNHHVENYVRLKVFTERGASEHATVNIPYSTRLKGSLVDVKGRTIKPDGTVIDLQKDAIFDKTDVKVGRKTLRRTRSFTLPNVTPGSIIEYQWQEVYTEYIPRYNILNFQREFPIQKVTYFVRPLVHSGFPWTMHAHPFNCQPTPWVQIREGNNEFVTTSLTNVPAVIDEPDSPSEDEIRKWMLLYYSEESNPDPKKYWPKLGRQFHGEFNQRIKINNDVKALAAEAVGDATNPHEQVIRIAEFCRTRIKNTAFLTAGITAEEREQFKFKPRSTSADTAKARIGTRDDINYLFAAMAQSRGFEVRGVRGSSQLTALMRPEFPDRYLLPSEFVAVRINDKWNYYNLSNPYRPVGMVAWDEENVPAILMDDKEPKFFTVPASSPQMNTTLKKAILRLKEDGSLTGKVTVSIYGHSGTSLKTLLEDQSEAKRIEDMEEEIRNTHGDIELSDVRIENVTDPTQPLVYSYEVTVNGYAEKTGKRIFFQPSFFQHGRPARFISQERKNPIAFRYPFQEMEEVTFELPEGYSLEKAEGIAPIKIGDIATYENTLTTSKDGKTVKGKRVLTWGIKGEMFYPAESYPQLKQAWDEIHSRDGHTLALKAD